jgi:nitrogen fixation/metabolism regulation signal transduction histidine kinase
MALAVLPTAIFAVFTLDQLGRSTQRWFRPGVDRALESGVEASKTGLTRMETTVLALADECASRIAARPGARPDDVARDLLRGSGVDMVQLYVRRTDGWTLSAQFEPEGILLPDPPDFRGEIDEALGSSRIVRSDLGALAALASIDEARVIAAAMWVPPSFFADIDSVGVTLGYYRQLGVLVDVQRRLVWTLVAALGLALAALAFLTARTLAAQMTKPLDELSGALARVAAGDLDTRVAARGAREIRVLGAAFNAMTERLADAREQLRAAEREAAWRDVARRLAHEFKNMLTPMSLSLHRLRRRSETVAEDQRQAVAESLESLDRGVDQLARLAEQFAQYARLPEPRFEQIDLSEVTRQAASLHDHPGVDVVPRMGPPLPVRGDSLLLSRAIHNLLLNACEASPPGTQVEVSTRVEDGQAMVEVLDRGTGMPAEVERRAFEPYVSTKQRGSGLGLSLVRDIAAQHGGTVLLENREQGGARACLRLPLARPVS